MISLLLASVLTLAPAVDEPMPLRLVSAGTGAADVVWYLDGTEVARTRDGQAGAVDLAAGRHDLHAVTEHAGAWEVLARPDPAAPGAAVYVTGWSAQHTPAPAPGGGRGLPVWVVPAGLGLLALAVAWPRRTKGP